MVCRGRTGRSQLGHRRSCAGNRLSDSSLCTFDMMCCLPQKQFLAYWPRRNDKANYPRRGTAAHSRESRCPKAGCAWISSVSPSITLGQANEIGSARDTDLKTMEQEWKNVRQDLQGLRHIAPFECGTWKCRAIFLKMLQ